MEKHIWLALVMLLACALLLCGCGNSKPEGEGTDPCVHDFGEWIVESQATCKKEGLLIRHCTKCDYVESSTAEITNVHTEVIDPEVPAACDKTGLSEGKHCAVCDAVLVAQQETPVVAHTYDDKYDESCNVCGHIRDAECAHKETEVIAGKAATCTEIGLTDGSKCKKCGEILVSQTAISVIDHSAGDWIVDKEATKTEEGKKHTECTMCGKWMAEESIPATGSIGLKYTLNSDGESYAVTKIGTCADTDVVIPAKYKGLPVTTIGSYAFSDCSSVTIPDSVTTISDSAFRGCNSLNEIWVNKKNPVYSSDNKGVLFNKEQTELIYMPEGYKGAYTIPDSVTTIGERAFSSCDSLTSVTIPDSVTTIGDSAFENCDSLTSMTIPDSVTTIGESAFYECTSLTSVTIPDSVTTIDSWAFSYCDSLTSITIPNSVTTIGGCAFHSCTSLTSITISDGVTTIGNSAFKYCSSLASVTIPDSVATIAQSAFSYCTSLKYVSIGDSVKTIGKYAFTGCDSLISITIPNNVLSIGMYAFAGCDSLTSVTIGNGISTIEDWAFIDCESLTTIAIGRSVTTIGKEAFRSCSALSSIEYNGSISQWYGISKGNDWNLSTGNYIIHCSDGQITRGGTATYN